MVTNDEIFAAITLKEFNGHVDRGHWEEVTCNEMEQTIAHFSIPQQVIDRIHPKQLASEYDCSSKSKSGASAMHLDIASYKFDSKYMFILYDKMEHFKEQASYICNWVEECLRKDDNILQCLKQIAVLQKTVVDNHFRGDKIIIGKEEMDKLLSKEVDKHTNVAEKEIQSVRVAYEEALETYNAEAS